MARLGCCPRVGGDVAVDEVENTGAGSFFFFFELDLEG